MMASLYMQIFKGACLGSDIYSVRNFYEHICWS